MVNKSTQKPLSRYAKTDAGRTLRNLLRALRLHLAYGGKFKHTLCVEVDHSITKEGLNEHRGAIMTCLRHCIDLWPDKAEHHAFPVEGNIVHYAIAYNRGLLWENPRRLALLDWLITELKDKTLKHELELALSRGLYDPEQGIFSGVSEEHRAEAEALLARWYATEDQKYLRLPLTMDTLNKRKLEWMIGELSHGSR